MNGLQALAERYLDSWNQTDEHRRREHFADVFTPDVTYVDPLRSLVGYDALSDEIAAVYEAFPRLTFRLGSAVDGHHGIARFTWHFGAPDAEPLVIGFDVVIIENERIRTVYGFIDRAPAHAVPEELIREGAILVGALRA